MAATNGIMKNINNKFHDNNEKFSCDICGHQVSQKKSMTRHKKIVHEGVKYPCRQCNKEYTDKDSLGRHKRSVHRAVKHNDQ